jgi:hypothetical protein
MSPLMFELDTYKLKMSEALPLESICVFGPGMGAIFVKLVMLLQLIPQFLLL